ncbi:regulator [Vibrio cyclitrophicus]
MTENELFRKFYCGLSIEDTADLCFRSVKTVKEWDSGKAIPYECRRLMRLISNRPIGTTREWSSFYMENEKLVLPNGQRLTASQVLLGAALIEIANESDRKTMVRTIKLARAMSKLLPINR